MDIASLSSFMSQSKVSQTVSIALTKKILDNASENAQTMLQTMEAGMNPNLGVHLDVRA